MKAELEYIQSGHDQRIRCYKGNADRFDFNWHYHPEYEITSILSGSGTRMIGQHVEPYRAGDLAMLGPNLPHTWYNNPGMEPGEQQSAVVLHFHQHHVDPLLKLPEFGTITAMLEKSQSGILFPYKTSLLITEKLLKLEKLSGSEKTIRFLEILDDLSNSAFEVIRINSGSTITSKPVVADRLERVHALVSEKFDQEISLKEASREARMSPSSFSRFFSRITGKTFVEYLNETRIQHACGRLIQSDDPVAAIALDCGFRSLSNFNRRFKSIKNCSPREFRNAFKPRMSS